MVDVDAVLDSGLFDAVKRSVEQASHLTDGDEGAVAACFALAQLIESQSREIGDDTDIKTLNTSYQNLQRYLTDLGLNPQGRRNLGLVDDGADDDGW